MNSLNNRSATAHFYFIDAWRGLAAIWVVLFHVSIENRLAQLYQVLPAWVRVPVFEWGGLGVAIFFVISGFVMAHSLRSAIVTIPYFKQFFLRRIARLNPPYYFAIAVALVLSFVAATVKGEPFAPMDQAFSVERLLAHLFYLQEVFGFTNFNDSFWTLNLEVQFYVAFVLLLGLSQWFEKKSIPVTRNQIFLGTAIAGALVPLGVFGELPRATLVPQVWYSFMLGTFAYWAWQRQLKPGIFYAYTAVIFAGSIIDQDLFPAACVLCAVTFFSVGRAKRLGEWLSGRIFQFLGRISYSLFLIHGPILGVVFFLGQKVLPPSPLADVVCIIGTLISSIVASMVMWQFVEKPAMILSQKLKSSPATVVNRDRAKV